jgi:hypothetical protein
MKRPLNAVYLEPPSYDAAMSMAGVLFHFVGGSRELRDRLARWMEHHEGDLDEQVILWYLTESHKQLEPRCTEPMDFNPYPGRVR